MHRLQTALKHYEEAVNDLTQASQLEPSDKGIAGVSGGCGKATEGVGGSEVSLIVSCFVYSYM